MWIDENTNLIFREFKIVLIEKNKKIEIQEFLKQNRIRKLSSSLSLSLKERKKREKKTNPLSISKYPISLV
jgi:hypothetical protein